MLILIAGAQLLLRWVRSGDGDEGDAAIPLGLPVEGELRYVGAFGWGAVVRRYRHVCPKSNDYRSMSMSMYPPA